jgi:hypothetical protein
LISASREVFVRHVNAVDAACKSVAEMLGTVYHDEESIVGQGCDDEFEFALDMLPAGFDKLRKSQ